MGRQTMTDPTNTDKARYVIERLGMCWHKVIAGYANHIGDVQCSCGKVFTEEEYQRHLEDHNPTFLDPAGRIQLLELMMGRDDSSTFSHRIGGDSKWLTDEDCISKWTILIPTKYMTQPGLLLDAAYQFLREKEK
jgi:hypothetical protein